MNWETYYCAKCDSILTSKCISDLTFHCGRYGQLHMLVYCKYVGQYPSDWTKWEVQAQARHEIEKFGVGRLEVVAHG